MEKIVLSNQKTNYTKSIESFCEQLQKEKRYAICSKEVYNKIFSDFKSDNVLAVKDLLLPDDSIYIIERKPHDMMLQF